MKLSLQSRREYLGKMHKRYRNTASRNEKSHILGEVFMSWNVFERFKL